jgi:type IX secretion system PorP/SprF family membrane protein
MKKLYVILLSLLMVTLTNAQQSALYTQYMNNPFLLNPSIAGTYQFYQARMSARLQWIGFDNAPVTNAVSFYGPWSAKRKNMGVGASVSMDATGPISTTAFSAAYAYNINLSEAINLSGGLALGGLNYKLDGTKFNLENSTDKALPMSVVSKTLPDATIGFYLSSNLFQVGLSADHLFNGNVSFVQTNTDKAFSKLARHYYLFGSYNYAWNRTWAIEPSLLLKAVTASPAQLDINCRAYYKRMYWFGLQVRTQDAVCVLLGCFLNKRFYLGYSYDYAAFSPVRAYNLGSHEFMVGYKFNTLK